MKKLMIALAAIGLSIAANAASTYWTCTYVAKAPENYVSGGLAYFVVGDTDVRSDILALAGKGAEKVAEGLDGSYNWKSAGANGSYSVTMANAVDNTKLGLPDSTTGNKAFIVIFDTATITDASNFYVTEVKEFATMGGTNKGNVPWGDQEDASSAKGAWNAVAVPEPTSGLLLLLGVAGMALRRRRA